MTTPLPISHPSPGLVLDSADSVLSAVPFLIGFTPADSAVLVWLRDGRLVLTQRVDLPPESDEEAWLDVVFNHAAAPICDEVFVIAYTDGDATGVLQHVRARAEFRGLYVLDALITDGERWRSLLHTGMECCRDGGHPIDASVRATVGAEFAVRGVAPSSSRADLERELAADPVVRLAVTALLAERAAGRVATLEHDDGNVERERRRDELIDACRRALQTVPSTAIDPRIDAADLVEGMSDIRVRDTLLWECSGLWDDELRVARAAFAAAVRIAPPGRVAPVATCAAVLAWLLGDGARASIALERAYQDDPNYSLLQLIDAAVRGGLPPDAWRASMQQLTRDECRHGFRPEPPKRKKKARKKKRR